MSSPYLVGITGGSASGKTFILNEIRKVFSNQELTLISQDNYYKDLKDQIPDENGLVNFDHPNTVDLNLLNQHINELLSGRSVSIREYNFNNPNSCEKILTYHPAPIIIIEGLFVYLTQELNQLLNLRIFIEVDEHIKLARRLRRDVTERGYPVHEILDQYEKDVVPMYRMFVEPLKSKADIILPNNNTYMNGVRVLINHLKAILRNF